MTWCPTARTLTYTVPEASRPFVQRALQATLERELPVVGYVLQEGAHHRFRQPLRLVEWHPPTAVFRLLVEAAPETASTGPILPAATPPPAPKKPDDDAPNHAAAAILDVVRSWGLDVGTDAIRFPLGADDFFVPCGLLYRVLANPAVEWCGEANRLGGTCLLQTFAAAYPPKAAFAVARAVVSRYRFPLLFLFGLRPRPGQPPPDEDEENAGLQAILFRPGRGETSRVHFRWAGDNPTQPPLLYIGEIGDVNPV